MLAIVRMNEPEYKFYSNVERSYVVKTQIISPHILSKDVFSGLHILVVSITAVVATENKCARDYIDE